MTAVSRSAIAKPGAIEPADDPVGLTGDFGFLMARRLPLATSTWAHRRFIAGRDFGDFIVWRRDEVPAYQLAVVVDDAAMGITEVVRGADLLKSTARQILLYRALGLAIPDFYHCDLVRDEDGVRLAKRHDSLSIRKLRELSWTPVQVREGTLSFSSLSCRSPDSGA